PPVGPGTDRRGYCRRLARRVARAEGWRHGAGLVMSFVSRFTERGSPMSDRAPAGFLDGVFDRTLANLRGAWREIALSARGVLSGAPRPDLPEDDVARLRQQMLSCLDGRGGEVTARARAAELGRTYLALNLGGRERFLRLLASEFDTDHDAVDRCCAGLAAVDTTAERIAAERALRAALLPPRVTLLRQFNALPEGVKFLVDRRAELIAIANGDLVLRGLADDLRDLLANWFDIGFLELPARSCRDQLRRFPDQAGRRCARRRIAAAEDLRDPVALARVSRLARRRGRTGPAVTAERSEDYRGGQRRHGRGRGG